MAGLCELGVIRASRDRAGGRWRIPRSSIDEWIASGQPMAVAS
ncbi:helix-turn-helix domain-containing protein [Dietzia sp. NPDC055877]